MAFRAHYEDMVKLNHEFTPMLEGCLANRAKWLDVDEVEEVNEDTFPSSKNKNIT